MLLWQKQAAVSAAWWIGLSLLAIGSGLGAIRQFEARSKTAQALEQALVAKSERLVLAQRAALSEEGEARLQAELTTNRRLCQEQRAGLEAIQSAAVQAGVTLTRLEAGQPRVLEEASLVACTHASRAVGSYQELSAYLSALQAAPGAVALEHVLLEPPAEFGRSGSSDHLQVSLELTWFCALEGALESALPAGQN